MRLRGSALEAYGVGEPLLVGRFRARLAHLVHEPVGALVRVVGVHHEDRMYQPGSRSQRPLCAAQTRLIPRSGERRCLSRPLAAST